MRIIHFLPTFDAGGLGSLGLNLIQYWPTFDGQQDHHVALASKFPDSKPVLLPDYQRVATFAAQIERNLLYPMEFVNNVWYGLQQFRYDVLLVYNLFDVVWVAQAARRGRPNLPVFAHLGTRPGASPGNIEQYAGFLNSPMSWGVKWIPASEAVRKSALQLIAPDRQQNVLPVVWNGVDLDIWNDGPAEPREQEPFQFVFTARLAENAKDWKWLAEFATHLRLLHVDESNKLVKDPGYWLNIIGSGADQHLIEATFDTQGRSHFKRNRAISTAEVLDFYRVRFVGGKSPNEVRTALLTEAHAFVMAALPIEGMSMALVEAIAAGLPIVASDVPANNETLGGGEFGGLYRNPIEAAFYAYKLIHDPVERKAASEKSKLRRKSLSIRTTTQKYREYLQGGLNA